LKLTIRAGGRAAFRTAAAALLALAAASAHTQEQPQWLTDALAREARLPEPRTVTSVDGRLQANVPGEVQHKVEMQSDAYSLTIQLGKELTVSCEVLRGSRDLAALLTETAEISFGELGKTNGEIEARAVQSTEAGAVGPHPFLALRWLYRAKLKGELRVGGLQQFAADLGDAVVYCANDELGYARTFDAVARALTSGLRLDGKPVQAGYFGEITVISIDGQRVGVASTSLTRDADGDTQVSNKSAMLLQRTPGQLIYQDVVDIQWVRPDGSLINALQVKSEQGKLVENLRLNPVEEGRWKAVGTLAGKDVEFEMPKAPSSFVALAQARRQLMAAPNPVGTSTEASTWSSLDLSRLLPTRATVLAPAGPAAFAVREELGGVAIEAVLDRKTGTMASARMPIGPRTMTLERVHQHGAF
jgi:hypothetical protein